MKLLTLERWLCQQIRLNSHHVPSPLGEGGRRPDEGFEPDAGSAPHPLPRERERKMLPRIGPLCDNLELDANF